MSRIEAMPRAIRHFHAGIQSGASLQLKFGGGQKESSPPLFPAFSFPSRPFLLSSFPPSFPLFLHSLLPSCPSLPPCSFHFFLPLPHSQSFISFPLGCLGSANAIWCNSRPKICKSVEVLKYTMYLYGEGAGIYTTKVKSTLRQ